MKTLNHRGPATSLGRKPALRVLAFAVLVTACLVPAVQAQEVYVVPLSNQSKTWVDNIGAQLGETLVSPSQDLQAGALQQTLSVATHYQGQVDLRPAVPALLAICETHSDEVYRRTAVAALHAIGDEEGMQGLRQLLTREASPRVQISMLSALMAYYGPGTFAQDREAAELAKELRNYYRAQKISAEARP